MAPSVAYQEVLEAVSKMASKTKYKAPFLNEWVSSRDVLEHLIQYEGIPDTCSMEDFNRAMGKHPDLDNVLESEQITVSVVRKITYIKDANGKQKNYYKFYYICGKGKEVVRKEFVIPKKGWQAVYDKQWGRPKASCSPPIRPWSTRVCWRIVSSTIIPPHP